MPYDELNELANKDPKAIPIPTRFFVCAIRAGVIDTEFYAHDFYSFATFIFQRETDKADVNADIMRRQVF